MRWEMRDEMGDEMGNEMGDEKGDEMGDGRQEIGVRIWDKRLWKKGLFF